MASDWNGFRGRFVVAARTASKSQDNDPGLMAEM